MSLEKGEKKIGRSSGWSNTFIVKVDKRTGETWILNHIPGNSRPDDKKYDHHLRWVPIPDHINRKHSVNLYFSFIVS